MRAMSDLASIVLTACVLGIGGGLVLLARGFRAYRRAAVVADTATSRIATLAVGEVRITGTIEPAEMTLVSPLQSRTCVYFRSKVEQHEGRSSRTVLREERAVGFRVADASGSIRIFPRDAGWDVPSAFHESDGMFGDAPVGLELRRGPAIQAVTADRDELVAALLTVRPFGTADVLSDPVGVGAGQGAGRREYDEARIEVGDVVTVIGTALPFDQLPDPDDADLGEGSGGPLAAASDPEIAADLDAARAAGTLETDPTEAWGNAAIPGFGIGRPVRPPELDPAATPVAVADAPTAERFRRIFEIGAQELVIASMPGRPLLIAAGTPTVAVARGQDSLILGLLGAVLAIVSGVVLAIQLSGGGIK